jgi:hypothetical protein
MTLSYTRTITIDLNYLGVLWIKLAPGKIGSQQKKCIALIHHMKA